MPAIEQYSGAMFGRNGAPVFSNSMLSDKSYVIQVMEAIQKLIQ